MVQLSILADSKLIGQKKRGMLSLMSNPTASSSVIQRKFQFHVTPQTVRNNINVPSSIVRARVHKPSSLGKMQKQRRLKLIWIEIELWKSIIIQSEISYCRRNTSLVSIHITVWLTFKNTSELQVAVLSYGKREVAKNIGWYSLS